MPKYIVQMRRGTTEEWAAHSDIIPRDGEIVIETLEDGGKNLYIGDGVTPFTNLTPFSGGADVDEKLNKKADRVNGTVISANQTFADLREWVDDNPSEEDRFGYFVTFGTNGKIQKATSEDTVAGVVIQSAGFSTGVSPDKLNEDDTIKGAYDFVAFNGLVTVRDDGTPIIGDYCIASDVGVATASPNSFGYKVVDRVDDEHINIYFSTNADALKRLQDNIDAAIETIVTDLATTTKAGLMSPADKIKLDAIEEGAQVNQNAFANITVDSQTVSAYDPESTVSLKAGSNIDITIDDTDNVVISSTVPDGSVTRQKLAAPLLDTLDQHTNDINVLDARVDEIMELTPGSTTGDAQLADIKNAWDGRTYSTPGGAVREQAKELNRIVSETVSPTLWSGGSIAAATGANAPNAKRIRTTYYIPEDADIVTAHGDMQFHLYAYNDNGAYVGMWNVDTSQFDTTGEWQTVQDVRELRAAYAGNLSLRIAARRAGDTTISDSQVAECAANIHYRKIMFDNGETAEKMKEMAEYSGSIVRMPDNAEWTIGHTITSAGKDRNSDPESPDYSVDAKYYAATDYYAPDFKRLYNLGKMIDAEGKFLNLQLHEYTVGKRWLRRTRLFAGSKIDLQDNTGFIRFTFGHASDYATVFVQDYFSLFDVIGVRNFPVNHLLRSQDFDWEMKYGINDKGMDVYSPTYFRSGYIAAAANGYEWSGNNVIHKTDPVDAEFETIAYIHEYDADRNWIRRSMITAAPVILTAKTAWIRFVCGRAYATRTTGGSASSGEIGVFSVKELTENDIKNHYSVAESAPTVSWGLSNLLANSEQLRNLKFAPLLGMPNQSSLGHFPAGVLVTGAPYSSARAYNKMIGIDVSIHTFLAAVANPRSVLYTRKLRTRNSATFYGTVCSAFDDYAMGFNFNVTTAFMRSWDILEQHPYTAIEVGDFLVNGDHTVLIVALKRDQYGRIETVTYSEAWPPKVRTIENQPFNTFQSTRVADGYKVYRYPKIDDVQYNQIPYVQCFDEEEPEIPPFPDIMSEYGDHAVLLAGESTAVNVLSTDGYTNIIVRNGATSVFETTTLTDFSLDALAAGNYDIIITDTPADPDADGAKTSHSYLHVVGCTCTFDEDTKEITFSGYGDAVPVTVNYSCGYYYGTPRKYDIINSIKILSDTDVAAGAVSVAELNPEPNPNYTVHGDVDYWASVIFQTKWGSATWRNKPFDGVWDAAQEIYEPMPRQYETI